MELDSAVHSAFENNKNGLSRALREDLDSEWTEIPEYFDVADPRKPVDKYITDELFTIIEEAFEQRKKVEASLTRRELVAYDEMLCKYLSQENLLPRLKYKISQDYNTLYQGQHMIELSKEKEKDFNIQTLKRASRQRKMNHDTKDPDSLYK